MKKNTAVTITIVAWDTILNAGKTGDTANITLRGVGDGTEFSPAGAASEVDATNLPGTYKVSLTAAENNYNSVMVGGKSATANVSIIGLSWINESEDFSATEKASLNAATPAASNMRGTDNAALAVDLAVVETSVNAIASDVALIPTTSSSALVDAFYEELTADHTTGGTFGLRFQRGQKI